MQIKGDVLAACSRALHLHVRAPHPPCIHDSLFFDKIGVSPQCFPLPNETPHRLLSELPIESGYCHLPSLTSQACSSLSCFRAPLALSIRREREYNGVSKQRRRGELETGIGRDERGGCQADEASALCSCCRMTYTSCASSL
ncbi:hypothetical protein SRHO_G00004670 [Serrasalmus rhombeus]